MTGPRNDRLPADLAEGLSLTAVRLGLFGNRITWHAETTSTNEIALLRAEQGAPEGTVVGADMQTAGRGRQGRAWSSPSGAGLYVSAIFRPSERIAPLLTIMAGASIADGIRQATGLSVTVKWPNDLFVERRKLAGILAEGGSSPVAGHHVVLGFGINVSAAAYPPDVASRATSLELELGRPVDRGLVLGECLAALALRYEQLSAGHARAVLDAWRAHAGRMLGRHVECTIGLRSMSGIAENIDDSGALLVRTPSGVVRVISGEVIWG